MNLLKVLFKLQLIVCVAPQAFKIKKVLKNVQKLKLRDYLFSFAIAKHLNFIAIKLS